VVAVVFNQDVAVIDAQKHARTEGLMTGVLWRSKTAVYSRLDSAAGRCPCPWAIFNAEDWEMVACSQRHGIVDRKHKRAS